MPCGEYLLDKCDGVWVLRGPKGWYAPFLVNLRIIFRISHHFFGGWDGIPLGILQHEFRMRKENARNKREISWERGEMRWCWHYYGDFRDDGYQYCLKCNQAKLVPCRHQWDHDKRRVSLSVFHNFVDCYICRKCKESKRVGCWQVENVQAYWFQMINTYDAQEGSILEIHDSVGLPHFCIIIRTSPSGFILSSLNGNRHFNDTIEICKSPRSKSLDRLRLDMGSLRSYLDDHGYKFVAIRGRMDEKLFNETIANNNFK